MIRKISIRNYRLFKSFDLAFQPGVNIIVGDNDAGKSTLIEAINLALTARIQGKSIFQEFPPFLLNMEATREYIEALRAPNRPPTAPPELIIDLFLEDTHDSEPLRGTNNLLNEDACGLRILAQLSPEYAEEYANFASEPDRVRLVPTEYYDVSWLNFSGNSVTIRSVPATSSVIDPATIRLQSGTDYHLQQIIRNHLDPRERVELSRQYRSLREDFSDNPSVRAINERLSSSRGEVSDRRLTLSIDISHRFTWESSLVPHLDDLPFHFIGKGEQNSLKTLLAISRRADSAHVVLVEEPENHLSFSSLRSLLAKIEQQCGGKQVIIATHSSFVLNKLGLENLVLLGPNTASRISDLDPQTANYFKKLSGYDTLRLVLAKSVILVEGPSDELMIQRAYLDEHDRLPIEDGIDVINVRGLSFKRFLDLAIQLKRRVRVVTDNDGKAVQEVLGRYSEYTSHNCVSLHVGEDPSLRTLEFQMARANGVSRLNSILGTDFSDETELVDHMLADKTSAALAIFESEQAISMPQYIRDAVA